MSKLVEKFKSLSREAAPIGFRSAGPSGQQPPLLIIGRPSMPADSPDFSAGALTGIDGAFMPGKGLTAGALKRLIETSPEVAFGFTIEGVDPAGFNGLVEAGADFIVFSLKAAAPVLETKKPGKFLELPGDTEAAKVMTAAELAPIIDGVVISGTGPTITLEYLLACRRAVRLFDVPVMVEVPASATEAEIRCLWEAGADGIIIGDTGALTGIKKTVESLPKGGRRQWGSKSKTRPVLPRLGESTATAEEDEDRFTSCRKASLSSSRWSAQSLSAWS